MNENKEILDKGSDVLKQELKKKKVLCRSTWMTKAVVPK